VYRDDDTTGTTLGVTDTASFNSVTGLNGLAIDTSASYSYYLPGHDYSVVLLAATIDGRTVHTVLGTFSIGNRCRHYVA